MITLADVHVKLIEPHVPDCVAVDHVREGIWRTPWFLNGARVYRDLLGRNQKHSWRRWAVLICNSPVVDPCPGRAIVLESDLEELVEGLL